MNFNVFIVLEKGRHLHPKVVNNIIVYVASFKVVRTIV